MWTLTLLAVYNEWFHWAADAQTCEVGGTIQPLTKCGNHSKFGNHFNNINHGNNIFLTIGNQE
jgi:hypothetical protein